MKTAVLPATDPEAVRRAAVILRDGGLVAFPTETVYGLGADAQRDEAVAAIYAAKARPQFNPLISHCASLAGAERYGIFAAEARRLAEAFWPGPLTLVVPARPGNAISLLARAGLDSVALRVPAHPVARALIEAAGLPVAGPSANRSGRISPTTADHVAAELDGRVDLVLDGGPCAVGLESTILSCLGPIRLLRPGGVTPEDIEAVLGHPLAIGPANDEAQPVSPGQLQSHYAPEARVRLDVTATEPGEAVLDFGGRLQAARTADHPYRDLSPEGDLSAAAAHLFAFLRELDASGATRIAVAPVPHRGLGAAINDRLRRAAAPRPAAEA